MSWADCYPYWLPCTRHKQIWLLFDACQTSVLITKYIRKQIVELILQQLWVNHFNIKCRKKSPNPPLCSSYTKKYWIAPSRRVCIFFLVASTFELFSSVIITSCSFLLCLEHIEAIFLWNHNFYPGKSWEILGNFGKSWEILRNSGKSWKSLGNPGKCWVILGNLGKS